MGIKGDKLKQDSVQAAEFLVSKLESIGGITAKKMFGGHGIFHDGNMFSIIDSAGKAFFKADDNTKKDFEAKGSPRHAKMPYYAIPDDVLENADELIEWAKKSINVSK